MGDEVFPEEARAERGLSRRKLIQRAAVVGAAAWSAPVIIDSLGSAAFAAKPSGCIPYWVKLRPNGSCYNAGPVTNGKGEDCNENFLYPVPFSLESGVRCASTCGASCTGSYSAKLPAITTVNVSGTDYYQITLQTGCYFTSLLGGVLNGRYDKSAELFGPDCSETRFVQTCAGGSATGNGRYVQNGNTGWVKKTVTFGTSTCLTNMPATYVYVQFCCNT